MTTPIGKPANALRILHTADWHLGKRLFEQTRYQEFAEFLDWLIDCITDNAVDVLIVAGDIFDTMTPSNKAQELYYQFLAKLNKTPCRHAIIVAGNHDSPSFLDAPKTLFRHFNIHIVGTVGTLCDELIVLDDKNNHPALMVATVPYLRERDVKNQSFGESLTSKEQAVAQGIAHHYQALAKLAHDKKADIATDHRPLPILATGHLFATGASIASDDDGMRSLYVGSLGQVGAEIFAGFDYVALGHIHREQMVGKQPHIRYSGSPMVFCFDEQNQDKKVLLVDFDNSTTPTVTPIVIPKFRELYQFSGNFDNIQANLLTLIEKLKNSPSDKEVWLSIECSPPIHDLKQKIETLIDNTPLILIAYKNKSIAHHQRNHTTSHQKTLTEMTALDVFDEVLIGIEKNNTLLKKSEQLILTNEQKTTLKNLYESIVFAIKDDDKMAI